jgi:acyl carrier protein
MTPPPSPKLERLRAAVGRIKDADLSGIDPNDGLNLGSVERISLIVELENDFGVELGETVTPEAFESLASLLALLDARA